MKKRIDIRIDETKLVEIDAYCAKYDKTRTAFIEKGIELMFAKYSIKSEYRPKRHWWNRMYSTRKNI